MIGVIIAVGVAFYLAQPEDAISSKCKVFDNEADACKNAARVAMVGRNGTVSNIEKKEILVPPLTLGGFGDTNVAWVVTISSQNEVIEVGVDIGTYKILSVGVP